MPDLRFPFAVRLIGFPESEAEAIEASLLAERGTGKGYGYFRLAEDNLQDPDLYVANADEPRALATLVALRPSDVRPALLIGNPGADQPYPRVERPIRWDRLFGALDALVEKRADVLSRLEASDIVPVPERRRRERIDPDTADPSEYERMRAKWPDKGAVLVVDRTPALRDYLDDLLARRNVPVAWVSDETRAVDSCERQPIAAVIINTSTPGVDGYRLCAAVKQKNAPVKVSVILLVSRADDYDVRQARAAGVDGYLIKPVSGHQLVSVLKKFLPFMR